MLYHWAKEWRGPLVLATSYYASQETCANRMRKAGIPKHLYLFSSVPWRFDCSFALRNFKISISSWTLDKSEAVILCKYWSFESMSLCPTAWSTGHAGEGRSGAQVLAVSNFWGTHGHVCTCLNLPAKSSRNFRSCQIQTQAACLLRTKVEQSEEMKD